MVLTILFFYLSDLCQRWWKRRASAPAIYRPRPHRLRGQRGPGRGRADGPSFPHPSQGDGRLRGGVEGGTRSNLRGQPPGRETAAAAVTDQRKDLVGRRRFNHGQK